MGGVQKIHISWWTDVKKSENHKKNSSGLKHKKTRREYVLTKNKVEKEKRKVEKMFGESCKKL